MINRGYDKGETNICDELKNEKNEIKRKLGDRRYFVTCVIVEFKWWSVWEWNSYSFYDELTQD